MSHPFRPMTATMLGLLVIAGATLSACSASLTPGGSIAAGSVPVATASQPVSAVPIESPVASATPAAAATPDPLGAFSCSLPVRAAATVSRAQITRVAVGSHAGYDRIVFEFASGLPAYLVEVATPPFAADPSDLPLTVSGTRFLHVVLRGGTAEALDGSLSYRGPVSFTPGSPVLVDLQSAGDFEAVASWYVGLRSNACIRVLTLRAPSRLVIDIEQP